MEWFVSSPLEWATMHFGLADLGDKRRTDRLVKLAEQMAADPAGSIPKQCETWADAKAAYRLFDQDDVTFEAVFQPHWSLSRQCGPGRFAILSDTTELDFGKDRQLTGVGPTGNGSGRGFLLHSGLMVDVRTKQPLCIAGAELLCRRPKQAKKAKGQRRESERWGDLVQRIGRAPEGAQWIHVMDRESDNFEVFCHCLEQEVDWVTRTRTLTRNVAATAEAAQAKELLPLRDLLEKLPVKGRYTLEVPTKAKTKREPARAARQATMQVRSGVMYLPSPATSTSSAVKARKKAGGGPIAMQVVWTREVDPPKGQEAVEWILYTSLAVTTLAEILEVLELYKLRWLIEEWHKAIKTGTQIKERQLETGERLAPLIALSCVEALRLLQLKTLARIDPERPATEVVPPRYLAMLTHALRMPKTKPMSVGKFFRGVARLGGFLARKGDGDPGWQTTWRGWEKLALMLRGQELGTQNCG